MDDDFKRDTSRFLLRLPSGLYQRLRDQAAGLSLSVNQLCVRLLSLPTSGLSNHPDAAALAVRATEVCGTGLLGLVLYGSWARQTAGPASDVDVLIVVDPALPLTRALYEAWDRQGASWDGRPVDPRFIHPPAASITGAWAEAATDGILLCERGFEISQALIRVRQEIASGRLVRRIAHGQPYWVAA